MISIEEIAGRSGGFYTAMRELALSLRSRERFGFIEFRFASSFSPQPYSFDEASAAKIPPVGRLIYWTSSEAKNCFSFSAPLPPWVRPP
jgi:hypothetical protein